jgi:hypothetical protein
MRADAEDLRRPARSRKLAASLCPISIMLPDFTIARSSDRLVVALPGAENLPGSPRVG